jgi:hypothetical protein
MSEFPKLDRQVEIVLAQQAARGITTKRDCTTLIWRRIENMGGPHSVGVGKAAVIVGCMHYIDREVGRQFNKSPNESAISYIRGTIPSELCSMLGRCTSWIAIAEGPGADWVPWKKAEARHWFMNYEMKRKKAEQTMAAARISLEVHDYLQTHGISCFGDIFT